jgi:hypothetical protein
MVPHAGAGLIDDPTARQRLREPNTKVGLFPAQRAATGMAEPREELEVLEDLSTEGHIRPDQVSDRGPCCGKAAVRTADHPVELGWKPGWAGGRPLGEDAAADRKHTCVVIGFIDPLEPVRLRLRVVVDEGDDPAACLMSARVA